MDDYNKIDQLMFLNFLVTDTDKSFLACFLESTIGSPYLWIPRVNSTNYQSKICENKFVLNPYFIIPYTIIYITFTLY